MDLSSKNSHYWDSMYRLRLSGLLCDIQLCVKDDTDNTVATPAHKTVMVASSMYFASCLDNNNLLSIYNFDGVSLAGLQKVLDYVYRQVSWADLLKTPEAEAIASTLQVVRHDPFDAPSTGFVFTNKDGANVVLMEKIRHSSKSKSSPKPVTRAKRANTKIFQDQSELNEALVQHKMRPMRSADQTFRDQNSVDQTADSQSKLQEPPVEIDNIVSVPLEGEEVGETEEEEAVLLESAVTYATEVNIEGELVHGSSIIEQQEPPEQQQQHHQEQQEQQQQQQQQQTELNEDTQEEETLTDDLSSSLQNAEQVIETEDHPIKVEQEKADIESFPASSKMDLLASASEMVQRRDVGRSNTDNLILDPMTGELVVDNKMSKDDNLLEIEMQEVAEIKEEAERRSRRIAKRKEVVKTVVSSARKKVKRDENVTEVAKVSSDGKGPEKDNDEKSGEMEKEEEMDGVVQEEGESEEGPEESSKDKTDISDEQDVEKTGQDEKDSRDILPVVRLKVEHTTVREEREGSPGNDEDEDAEKLARLQALKSSIKVARPKIQFEQESPIIVQPIYRSKQQKQPSQPKRPSTKNKRTVTHTEYHCADCDKFFVNLTGYKNHMSYTHHGVEVHPKDGQTYKCETCGSGFTTFAALATHARMQHKEVGSEGYECQECPPGKQKFKYHRDLKLHLVREHNMELWFCKLCQKSFQSQEGHKIHMFKQHSGAEASNVCDICGKGFVREAELRNHVKITHSEERPYKCMVCERAGQANAFKTNNALRRHIHTVHTSTRHFCCDVCCTGFKTKNDMHRHRAKHFRSKNPMPQDGARRKDAVDNFMCDICDKSYKNAGSLATHQRVQHVEKDDTVSYMCTFCNKSFAVKQYLLMHLRNIHEPKKYQCEACGLSFAQRYELKRHTPKCRGYRLGNKPYGCVQCGKTFTLKGNLTKHLSTSCKGRRKENEVDFVLMMQKDAVEEEETQQDTSESGEHSHLEISHDDSQVYHEAPDGNRYVLHEADTDDPDTETHQQIVLGEGGEGQGSSSEAVMVTVETHNENGDVVYKQVALSSVLEQSDGRVFKLEEDLEQDDGDGQGGIVLAEHHEHVMAAAADSVHHEQQQHESRRIVLPEGHVMIPQAQIISSDQVIMSEDGHIMTEEDLMGVHGTVVEIQGEEVEGGIMDVQGDVMYEVSGEEIVGVQEVLETQGLKVVHEVESQ